MPDVITTTVDVPNCPQCGGLAKQMGRQDRACLTCGLAWKVVTEQDELDAEADRLIRSRGYAEEHGRGRTVGKGATRW